MHYLRKSPVQTFILVPLAVLIGELALGGPRFQPAGVVLMAWGYAQYRLVGRYRVRLGGGGPGLFGGAPARVLRRAARTARRERHLPLDAQPDVPRPRPLHDRRRGGVPIVVRRRDHHRSHGLVPFPRAARRARAKSAVRCALHRVHEAREALASGPLLETRKGVRAIFP